ncbi:MAG TPA: VOC family protein [Candidatus Acidoferrales bacterium]|nr:VOC family protein [Candidatus Acidoferrales bacterium]
MTDWFARPVLHVTDVEASLRFYINRLGFTSPWRYDEDGKAHIAQVDRRGCALLLADTQFFRGNPARFRAREDWPWTDLYLPERRAADARSCDRRIGCAARGT